MKKRIFLLLLVAVSMLLISCSKTDNNTKEADTTKKDTASQTQISDTKSSETQDDTEVSTKETAMNNEILKNNKINADVEKINSIAVRSGNTGETVLTITDKDSLAEIAKDILAVEFTEHAETQTDGLRYELIINGDKEIHIVINSNSDLYIRVDNVNQKTDCETDFDLIGYIENTLLNTEE